MDKDNFTYKVFDASMKILKDKNVEQELKLFVILDLLHENIISLHKAHELCTDAGLFSDHWMVLDGKIAEIWHGYYGEETGK